MRKGCESTKSLGKGGRGLWQIIGNIMYSEKTWVNLILNDGEEKTIKRGQSLKYWVNEMIYIKASEIFKNGCKKWWNYHSSLSQFFPETN